MRVIGVLDLVGGRAVHARAGRRAGYLPLPSVAGTAIDPGDAAAVARIYLDRFGLRELYAADLDAIQGAAMQETTIATVASVGAALWLDAAITSVAGARRAIDLGAAHVVVGLETLTSVDALAAISKAVGGQHVAFSLDLRDGEPVTRPGAFAAEPPETIAARAAAAGAGSVLVIDLARVGSEGGIDLELIRRVRAAVPRVMLLAGGGVRGAEDLYGLAEAGCDGALVASALHSGRLTPDEIAATTAGQR